MSGGGRFAIVPARAVEDQRLGNAALRVLCCLGTYSDKDGWCHPSMRTISERIGLTRQTIIEHIQHLARLGYVEIRRRARPDGGKAANQYRLLFDRGLFAVQARLEQAEQPMLPMSGQPTSRHVGPADMPMSSQPTPHVGPEPTSKIKERPKRTIHSRSVDTDPEIATRFENFWRVYPSRGEHANPKKPARLKFEAAVRKGADPAAIIRGAENFATYVVQNGVDPRFVPMAQTWLNQDRWTQYQEAPRQRAWAGLC